MPAYVGNLSVSNELEIHSKKKMQLLGFYGWASIGSFSDKFSFFKLVPGIFNKYEK